VTLCQPVLNAMERTLFSDEQNYRGGEEHLLHWYGQEIPSGALRGRLHRLREPTEDLTEYILIFL